MAALIILLGTAGCGGSGLEKGGCVLPDGDQEHRSADCADPGALRVLEIRGPSEFCRDVPAVTAAYESWGDSRRYCLGPPNADPAAAINTARVGDCADAGGDSYVRVDCADPAAQLQILHRVDGYAVTLDGCASIAGTTVEYEWRLEGTGMAGLSTDNIFFCFGPVGVDPRTFIEMAQPGDCVKETGGQPEWMVVACGQPDAAYRVHGRTDGFVAAVTACEDTPDATRKLMGSGPGTFDEPYTLCLGPV